MQPEALQQVAEWGRIAAWGLLPQALVSIALAVLAAQERMRAAVVAYAAALLLLLAFAPREGGALMLALNLSWAGVAAVALAAMGSGLRQWLPWRALATAFGALAGVWLVLAFAGAPRHLPTQFAAGGVAATAVLVLTWCFSPELRAALRR